MRLLVIIPTYLPGEYLKECLLSLNNQSCSFDDFEVVIILNGEREPYFDIICRYLKGMKFNYQLIYTENKGVSNARNIGIEYGFQTNKDFILFLDDDDKLSSTYIENCLKKASAEHLIISNYKTFLNDLDDRFGEDYLSRAYQRNVNKHFSLYQYRSFFSSMCGKVIPLGFINEIRFNPKFKLGEDSLFGFELSKNVLNCVLTDEHSIYYRRLRVGSASRSKPSINYKISNYVNLIFLYTKIYISNIRKIPFSFYMSRVIASIIHILK